MQHTGGPDGVSLQTKFMPPAASSIRGINKGGRRACFHHGSSECELRSRAPHPHAGGPAQRSRASQTGHRPQGPVSPTPVDNAGSAAGLQRRYRGLPRGQNVTMSHPVFDLNDKLPPPPRCAIHQVSCNLQYAASIQICIFIY